MNETVLTTIAFTGFTVAFFHAANSDPLVALRGSGSCTTLESFQNTPNYRISQHRHVRTTALLGLILTIFGVALSSRIGTWFPRIAGALLPDSVYSTSGGNFPATVETSMSINISMN